MAQTYKMKHNPQGTIYSLLTVESDGRMTMTFHGTDREICHEVTENEDGWLCYPGAMFPGLASGRWNKMDDGRWKMEDVVETTTFAIKREQGDTCINHAEREQSQDCESSVNFTNCMDNESVVVKTNTNDTNGTNNKSRPRRQRKPRKSRVECQPSAIGRQTSAISHQTSAISHQTSSTLKAVGMVAAATVALFVIYETGLLIPLGLIGLATGGILK